jgi:hypothetical protein
MDAYVELVREDGTTERHRIEHERITLGRSPSAGISVPDGRDLEPEHLLIQPRPDGCWVAVAQGAKVPAKLKGEVFAHGIVPWNSELELGSFRVRLSDTAPQDRDAKKKTSPVVMYGAPLIAICVLVIMLDGGGAANVERDAPERPELWTEAGRCEGDRDAVAFSARRESEAAFALSETYPFRPNDGVQSVSHYRNSASCFQMLGNVEAAARMTSEADFMSERIDLDINTHALRLDRAMRQDRWDDALAEAQALIDIYVPKERDDSYDPPPYVRWLSRNYQAFMTLSEKAKAQ